MTFCCKEMTQDAEKCKRNPYACSKQIDMK